MTIRNWLGKNKNDLFCGLDALKRDGWLLVSGVNGWGTGWALLKNKGRKASFFWSVDGTIFSVKDGRKLYKLDV